MDNIFEFNDYADFKYDYASENSDGNFFVIDIDVYFSNTSRYHDIVISSNVTQTLINENVSNSKINSSGSNNEESD